MEISLKMKLMDWSLKDLSEDEKPVSAGFWYDAESGGLDKFISCLADEETRKACDAAYQLLSKLEKVTDNITEWM